MGSIIGLIIFIADIWAIVQTLQTPNTAGIKVLWVLIIVLLPVVGLLLWFFLGPKRLRA
jgi:hypothetical protein